MVLNLGMLGFFKYFNFFAESLHALLLNAGVPIPLSHLEVVLPIGISFYTFQSMSYVIDVYRREIAPTRNLIQFATFVSFFPHLVAGPIMRPSSLLPQVASQTAVRSASVLRRLVPDLLGPAQEGRRSPTTWRSSSTTCSAAGRRSTAAWPCWRSTRLPSRSTATSRATPTSPAASAKCLGFEMPLNFNLPYFATSPKDFWSRWHISLSTWLRDYLYIPLGGGRGGRLLTYRNLMLTMVLGGLWHGAAWTFVVWGIYHGLLLVAHRLASPWLERIQPADPVDRACWKALRIVVTFHLVCLGWLFFRAESMEQALGMLERDRQPPGDSRRVLP